MKLSATWRFIAAFALLLWSGLALQAQQPTAPAAPRGKVLYQRSTTDPAPLPHHDASDPTLTSTVTDADRAAITFTRYALDIRLQPAQGSLAVRAQLTVRNDGDHPVTQLPLQLSSTLHWEDVRLAGATHPRFRVSPIASDADHTGKLNEAAIVLSTPLAPAATLDLDVIYSGAIPQNADRLLRIGTPAEIANHSDWDRISSNFIGLRGFGNVVWYPVASVPVALGDGDKLFAEIGRLKLRHASAIVSMTVTDEASDSIPSVAVLNGSVVPLTTAAGTEQAPLASLLQCHQQAAPLGFQTLSLFLADRHRRTGNALDVYARPDNENAVQPYLAAGTMVTPLLRTWLGDHPAHPLSVLDLASIDDTPFEERQTLYTGLQPVTATQLTDPLSHALAHSYFQSPRPWLNEGVAHFMNSLWTEQSQTRDIAIAQLDSQRGALALVEPSDNTGPPRPSLLATPDAIFYRTKSTYVLWMLRSMLGDNALAAALKTYNPVEDTSDAYFEELCAKSAASQPIATTTAPISPKDLLTFFEDWVYHDRGLPDLAITGVFPSKSSAPNSYLVAVNVTNSGGASANVPVIINSGTTQVSERMLIPAHGTASRRILIQDAPIKVQLNDGTVPETQASEHVQQIHYTEPSTP